MKTSSFGSGHAAQIATSIRRRLRWWRDDEGATAIVVAVLIIAFLALASISVDAGVLFSERRDLQTAADAAALAGVRSLPDDPSGAVAYADNYVDLNNPAVDDRSFVVSQTYVPNDTIRVFTGHTDVGLFFARFFSPAQLSEAIGAEAVAIVSSPAAYGKGVMPLGIMSKEPSGTTTFGYEFNELVRLKQPPQDGSPGNFQFLDLVGGPENQGGGSPDVLRDGIQVGGVQEPVYKPALYYTQTGINGSNVEDSLWKWIGTDDTCSFTDVAVKNVDGTVDIVDDSCHRLIICPIIVDPGPPERYNWNDIKGNSLVKIVGFAYFYVEAWGTPGKDCYIDGRFIRPLGDDEDVLVWGPLDPTGSIVFRLVD